LQGQFFAEQISKHKREEVQKLHYTDETEANEDATYTADITCKMTIFMIAGGLIAGG